MSLEPIGKSRIGFASRLGFGASGIGTLYRNVPEAQAQEVLHSAYDAGFRYFDTAPLYGHGLSELRLGQFLRTVPRQSFTVSTKVGRYLVPPRGEDVDYGIWASPLRLKPVFDYSYQGTMRSLEQSANRLGFSEFDLVYIHDVDRYTHGETFERRFDEAIDGCYRALDELRKAGHIRAVGIGVNESDIATRFLQNASLDAVMIAGRYSLLDQSAADDLLPLAASKGVEIVVAGVFNSGILASGPTSANVTYDYKAPPVAVVDKAKHLAALCEKHNIPLQAAALQFPFRHSSVSVAVIGMSHKDRVDQNVRWFEWPIPTSFWDDAAQSGLIAE